MTNLESDIVIFGYGPIVNEIIKRKTDTNQSVICITDSSNMEIVKETNADVLFINRKQTREVTINCKNAFFAWRDDSALISKTNNLTDWIQQNLKIEDRSYLFSSASIYRDSKTSLTEHTRNLAANKNQNGKYRLEEALKKLMLNKGTPQVNLRISNLYGEDIKYGFIGSLIDALKKSIPVKVFSNGNFIRDYISFDDFYQAISSLCKSEFKKSVINLSSGKGYSVQSVIEFFKENGLSTNLIQPVLADTNVRKCSILDNGALKSIIDWEPKYLEETLPELLWHSRNQSD
jgi:nucleoside-diphosphate-sugar epimerase